MSGLVARTSPPHTPQGHTHGHRRVHTYTPHAHTHRLAYRHGHTTDTHRLIRADTQAHRDTPARHTHTARTHSQPGACSDRRGSHACLPRGLAQPVRPLACSSPAHWSFMSLVFLAHTPLLAPGTLRNSEMEKNLCPETAVSQCPGSRRIASKPPTFRFIRSV